MKTTNIFLAGASTDSTVKDSVMELIGNKLDGVKFPLDFNNSWYDNNTMLEPMSFYTDLENIEKCDVVFASAVPYSYVEVATQVMFAMTKQKPVFYLCSKETSFEELPYYCKGFNFSYCDVESDLVSECYRLTRNERSALNHLSLLYMNNINYVINDISVFITYIRNGCQFN